MSPRYVAVLGVGAGILKVLKVICILFLSLFCPLSLLVLLLGTFYTIHQSPPFTTIFSQIYSSDLGLL